MPGGGGVSRMDRRAPPTATPHNHSPPSPLHPPLCPAQLSAEESARRGGYGGERYERTEFQSRVAACFGQLQEGDPRWVVVDAAQQVEAITEQVQGG